MLGSFDTKTLRHAVMTGKVDEGFKVSTIDGRPARLAIVDENGNVLEAGAEVAHEAWNIAMQTFENFWRGNGHLRVFSKPPEQ